jgi:hypothetical protein
MLLFQPRLMSAAGRTACWPTTTTTTARTVTDGNLDGDMLLPPGVLREMASRAADDLVLLGFRQHVPLAARRMRVAPVRTASGLHIDPPGTQEENGKKQSSLDRTVAFYRSLLAQPMPVGGRRWFHEHSSRLLREAVVMTKAGRIPSIMSSLN